MPFEKRAPFVQRESIERWEINIFKHFARIPNTFFSGKKERLSLQGDSGGEFWRTVDRLDYNTLKVEDKVRVIFQKRGFRHGRFSHALSVIWKKKLEEI